MITAYERVISHCTRLSGLYASASGMTMPPQGDLSAFWRFLYIYSKAIGQKGVLWLKRFLLVGL